MPAGRKTRTDAERNRRRVLEVARTLLAEHGDEVQMSDVAREAGVGVGTVYRHFPTRQALIEAAAELRSREVLDFARTECLTHPDPVEGLALFFDRIGEVMSQDRGLSAAMEAATGSSAPRGETGAQLLAVASTLIERGRSAGTLRQDSTVADAQMIIHSLAAIVRYGSGDWRRFIEIAVDGLRSH